MAQQDDRREQGRGRGRGRGRASSSGGYAGVPEERNAPGNVWTASGRGRASSSGGYAGVPEERNAPGNVWTARIDVGVSGLAGNENSRPRGRGRASNSGTDVGNQAGGPNVGVGNVKHPWGRTGSDRTGTGSDRTGTGSGRTGTGSDRTGTGSDRTGTGSGRTGTGSDRTGTGSGRTGADDRGQNTGVGTSSSWRTEAGSSHTSISRMQNLMIVGNKGKGDNDSREITRFTRKEKLEAAWRSENFVTKANPSRSKKASVNRRIPLISNYFRFKSVDRWCLYEYRVDFEPEEEDIRSRRALIRTWCEKIGFYLFDGHQLFFFKKIPTNPVSFVSKRLDGTNVKVHVKLVREVQSDDLHYLTVFNILVRNCLRTLNLTLIKRYYYDLKKRIDVPGYEFSLFPGYITSIRQHDGGVLMCVQPTFKVIRNETAYDVFRRIHRDCPENVINTYQREMIGQTVMTMYNNRSYRIDGVNFKANPLSTFKKKDGTHVVYFDYYRQVYNITVKDLKQPLLMSKRSNRDSNSEDEPYIAFIPELCQMTEFTEAQRNDFKLTREVSKVTRITPNQRIEQCLQLNRQISRTSATVDLIRNFNLNLDSRLVEIDGYVIPPTSIVVDRNITIPVNNYCDWTNGIRSNPMLKVARIRNWAIVAPAQEARRVQEFISDLQKAGRGMDFPIPIPKIEYLKRTFPADYAKEGEAVITQGDLDLILFIVLRKDAALYKVIKKLCCVERPIPSQVVFIRNCGSDCRQALSIATKIAIQLNCKLGGSPWTYLVPKRLKLSMVIGFDVCHRKTLENRKSVGAFIASLSSDFTKFWSRVSFFNPRQEISDNFPGDLTTALMEFQKIHKQYPDNVFIFRDGVGDGQIEKVIECEKNPCDEVVKKLGRDGSKAPEIIFTIVNKRIHSRIATPNGYNPTPGTIVDDVITYPHRDDFYLVPQSVGLGTASPTYYNVISDNPMPIEDFQQFTYHLTHMYYNFSGTIKVPAPCQYAHKLAFLVGQYLGDQLPNPSLDKLLYYL